MDTTTKAFLKQAMELPKAERERIVQELIQSLQPPVAPEVDQAWREEVARRVEAHDAGRLGSVPWEEVRDSFKCRQNARKAS